MEGSWKIDLK
jgi:hypothetical protein